VVGEGDGAEIEMGSDGVPPTLLESGADKKVKESDTIKKKGSWTHIALFYYAVGNMAMESLHFAAAEPISWWKLHLKGQKIRPASLLRGTLQRCFPKLKIKLTECVRELMPQADPLAYEKMARLSHTPESWLFQVLENKDPPRTEIRSGKEVASKIQPYEKYGRYLNYPKEPIWRNLFGTICGLFPGALASPTKENLKTWHRVEWTPCARSLKPKITWLGHAGLLVQGANINLLLDPSFDFVSPCFIRHTQPPIPFEKLPLIDAVALSHNHADHFSQAKVEKLMPFQPAIFVPHRLDSWFSQRGFTQVQGKKWWQSSVLERDGRTMRLTALSAHHGSATSLFDVNQSLWMSILIEVENHRILFAGDTAFNQEFIHEIRDQFGPIDVACLPIAPRNESHLHLDEVRALVAFKLLNAKHMIPIHYGAYRTGAEKIEDPLHWLRQAAAERNLTNRIAILKLGETFSLPHLP